jgi:hypothetical protein
MQLQYRPYWDYALGIAVCRKRILKTPYDPISARDDSRKRLTVPPQQVAPPLGAPAAASSDLRPGCQISQPTALERPA